MYPASKSADLLLSTAATSKRWAESLGPDRPPIALTGIATLDKETPLPLTNSTRRHLTAHMRYLYGFPMQLLETLQILNAPYAGQRIRRISAKNLQHIDADIQSPRPPCLVGSGIGQRVIRG